MQSTGQACTHNSSLVQVSVMTYAILPAVAIAGPATRTANYQKRRGEYLQSGWFGCAMTPSGVGTDATLGSDEDRNPRRPCGPPHRPRHRRRHHAHPPLHHV